MRNTSNKLNAKSEVDLKPIAPFSFNDTFHKPSHFPTPDIYHEADTYWQTIRFKEHIYGLKLEKVGTIARPIIHVSVYYEGKEGLPDLTALSEEIEFRFDLRRDLRKFNEEFRNDPILGPAIERRNGMRVSTPYSLYEFMVVTVVLQNTGVRRSVQMMQNLFSEYGTLNTFDGKDLYAFWAPQMIASADEESLRSLKLGYRAKTLKRQAESFVTGNINTGLWRALDRESLKKTLLGIYGIGPATVQYLMFEVFHHFDVYEHIPPWEQKIFSKLLFDKELVATDVLLEEFNRRWGHWKMLALHYIFEDLFWLRKNQSVPWLEELIGL